MLKRYTRYSVRAKLRYLILKKTNKQINSYINNIGNGSINLVIMVSLVCYITPSLKNKINLSQIFITPKTHIHI